MKNTLERLVASFLPFIIIGISLVLFVIGIVVFSYVLLIGALIGLVLFAIAFIHNKFFNKAKKVNIHQQKPKSASEKGRVIDHD